jgi:hypothetical protein
MPFRFGCAGKQVLGAIDGAVSFGVHEGVAVL